MNALANYFKEAISELKKVVWPTKTQTKNYSLIVIAMSIGVALFFGILDFILKQGVTALI
ncbi:MAG: preprotein translocase subunit SecE [Candidatus Magasanikbacteria bacterium]|jgi:preprotein translocase subunit SecE|nr:preprotein translocase subunit SecE [Candidatus Magasanikbacteria bacterium]